MSAASTITPASFQPSDSPTTSPAREVAPSSPEFLQRQKAETTDLFDEPASEETDLTGGQEAPLDDPKPAAKPAQAPAVPAPVDQPPAQPPQTDATVLSDAMVEALKKSGLVPQAAPAQDQQPAQMTDEEF